MREGLDTSETNLVSEPRLFLPLGAKEWL